MFDDQSEHEVVGTTTTLSTPRTTQPSKITLSGPLKIDLSVYRGDTGRFRITVRDPAGNPIDISGGTYDADIRMKAADTDTIASFLIQAVAGDVASMDVVLDEANSDLLVNGCVYDVEMRLGTDVTTLVYGTITVTQDVSRP